MGLTGKGGNNNIIRQTLFVVYTNITLIDFT